MDGIYSRAGTQSRLRFRDGFEGGVLIHPSFRNQANIKQTQGESTYYMLSSLDVSIHYIGGNVLEPKCNIIVSP